MLRRQVSAAIGGNVERAARPVLRLAATKTTPAPPCGGTSRGQPHPCGARGVPTAPMSRCRFCALPAIHDAITPGPQFGEVHRACFIAWDDEQEAMELEFGRAAFMPDPTDCQLELEFETDRASAQAA